MIDHSKFDFIEDLPVSEEMIGAYLEGNLLGSELREVSNFVESDDNLYCIVNEVESISNIQEETESNLQTINSPLLDFAVEFTLPAIETFSNTEPYIPADDIITSAYIPDTHNHNEDIDCDEIQGDTEFPHLPEDEINL